MLSRVSFYGPEDRTKVACQDCDWTGKAGELEAISDFSERVSPGETCQMAVTRAQFLAAKHYVQSLRCVAKQCYARDYLEWITSHSPHRLPPSYECSTMAAQAVRMNVDRALST